MAVNDANLQINVAGGATATISTDFVIDSYGATSHVQLFKLVWGNTSDANRITTSNPLPTYLASTGVTEKAVPPQIVIPLMLFTKGVV